MTDQVNCKHCKCDHPETLTYLKQKVDDVYQFRDMFFENHDVSEAINKNSQVGKLLQDTLEIFKAHENEALSNNKANFYFLKGLLLNVASEYNKEAEDLLSKAIKLDKKLVEAWNELGECYWKNNELLKAINCYEGALKEQYNKISLRNLSMLLRQEVGTTNEHRINNVTKSLEYAKKAVDLDPQDGLSWSILGNAHLSTFFAVQQNPKTLKLCLSAYAQAEKDIVAKSTPDLYYNKGITLRYEEEYELALKSFHQATMYDPTWELPEIKEQMLIKYLNDITEMYASCGKMKTKRLQQILSSIDSKQLGPYGGGSYTSTNGQTVKLLEVPFDGLKCGMNDEKVVLGKVVCSIRNEDTVPFTFCMVDSKKTCCVVTVFNLAQGGGVIINDSVAIPEPFVTDVDFQYKLHKLKFRLIRVETPIVLVVNGKKLGRKEQAGVQLSVFKKFD